MATARTATTEVSTPVPGVTSEDKSKFEYVTVPETDTVFDQTFPTIRINNHEFEAGKKYFLNPDIAGEVRRIIRTFEQAQLRILQPKKDISALKNLRETRGHSGQDFGENLRD